MNDLETSKRRNFLKTTLALGATALINPINAIASSSEKVDEFAILVGPYLQSEFNNSVTIHWLTNKNANSWVEYGEEANNLSRKVFGNSHFGHKPEGRINKVTLRNLIPGKKYFYKIVSNEINYAQPYLATYKSLVSSEVQNFINVDPNKKEMSFLMLNDIHDRPKSIPHLLGMDNPNTHDFVFFNGDIFNYQVDEKQIINNMLQPCVDAFAKNTPFVYVRGNHETRGQFRNEFLNYFENVGKLAFTLGPVRFVILDTGEDKLDSDNAYANLVDFDAYRLEQAEWFKNEIKSNEYRKAPFRIVLMHIPPLFPGDWPGTKHCADLFDPLLNLGKVDLVLSGHTHQYIIHKPGVSTNHYPLVIGGGPKEGTRTLTKITANSNELNVKMLDDLGKEVGNYTARRK